MYAFHKASVIIAGLMWKTREMCKEQWLDGNVNIKPSETPVSEVGNNK